MLALLVSLFIQAAPEKEAPKKESPPKEIIAITGVRVITVGKEDLSIPFSPFPQMLKVEWIGL